MHFCLSSSSHPLILNFATQNSASLRLAAASRGLVFFLFSFFCQPLGSFFFRSGLPVSIPHPPPPPHTHTQEGITSPRLFRCVFVPQRERRFQTHTRPLTFHTLSAQICTSIPVWLLHLNTQRNFVSVRAQAAELHMWLQRQQSRRLFLTTRLQTWRLD